MHSELAFDLSGMANGVYMVRVINGEVITVESGQTVILCFLYLLFAPHIVLGFLLFLIHYGTLPFHATPLKNTAGIKPASIYPPCRAILAPSVERSTKVKKASLINCAMGF